MKGPLNAARVAGKVGLTEAFEKALTSTLGFLRARECVKATNPSIRTQSLIRGYRAAVEAKCECLHKQLVAETVRVDELAEAISSSKIRSQSF